MYNPGTEFKPTDRCNDVIGYRSILAQEGAALSIVTVFIQTTQTDGHIFGCCEHTQWRHVVTHMHPHHVTRETVPQYRNDDHHDLYLWRGLQLLNHPLNCTHPVWWLHNDIDILFLQEVVAESLNAIRGYQVKYNIALMRRETAIITRETIPLHGIEKLPSGRGMSGNITKHSPATHTPLLAITRNRKGEAFFNTDLIY